MYLCEYIVVDRQGTTYMVQNCAIENGWADLEGLHYQQHCEVLMGRVVCIARLHSV